MNQSADECIFYKIEQIKCLKDHKQWKSQQFFDCDFNDPGLFTLKEGDVKILYLNIEKKKINM